MKIYQVDAFTSKPYAGNPAGVTIVEEFPTMQEMQNIAVEMNLSETAFVKHIENDSYQIKFFTPSEEIDLCGHATLSSAHILFELGLIAGRQIHFKTNFEEVYVVESDQGYSMDFPLWDYKKIDDVVRAEQITWINNILNVYDSDKKWKVVEVASKQEILDMEPDFWSMKGTKYGNVIAMSKWDGIYDYYMRCFVTDCWINEDPVTWSVECLLAPLWWKNLNKKHLKSYQCSQRWWEKVMLLMDNRVSISGRAITVFEIESCI